MASALNASLFRGLGAEPPNGVQGQNPGGGQGTKPPKAEDLCLISK
jgi:hypothetical protein